MMPRKIPAPIRAKDSEAGLAFNIETIFREMLANRYKTPGTKMMRVVIFKFKRSADSSAAPSFCFLSTWPEKNRRRRTKMNEFKPYMTPAAQHR